MRKEVLEYIITAKDKATKTFDSVNKAASSAAGGFKVIAGGAAAATAAITAVVAASINFSEQAGKLKDVENTFSKLADNVGISTDHLMSKFQEVTDSTISNADLMKQSVKASMLGIPIEKMSGLMEIARTQAVTMGEDVGYMLDSIVTGVGRASPLILDNLGITLKMGEVYENAATSLGKSADAMTDAEKKTALLNAVTEWGAEKQAEMGGAVDSNAASAQQLKARLTNLKDELLVNLLPVFNSVVDMAGRIVDGFGNMSDKANELKRALDPVKELFITIKGKLKPLVDLLGTAAIRFQQIAKSMGISGEFGGLINQFKNMTDKIDFYTKRAVNIVSDFYEKVKSFLAFGDTGGEATIIQALEGIWNRLQPLKETIEPLLTSMMENFRLTGEIFRTQVKPAFDDLMAVLKPLGEAILPIVIFAIKAAAVVIGLIVVRILAVITGISSGLANALPYIAQALEGAIQFFRGFVQLVTGLLTGDLRLAWEGMKQMVKGAVDYVTNYFTALIKFLSGFVKGVVEFFKGLYDTLVGHSIIPDMVDEIIEHIQRMVTDVLEKIKGWVSDIGEFAGQIYQKLVDPFEKAWTKISEIAGNIRESIAEAFDMDKRNSPSINDRLATLKSGVQETLDSVTVPQYSHDIATALAPTQSDTTNNVTFNNNINNDLDLEMVDYQLAIALNTRGMY